ncbi:hypothetical protein C8F01DRAFT_1371990 [Mycena amicta]|nr:hypothetical protein C8F01DRAFT_1371990 [Mycena amicta]
MYSRQPWTAGIGNVHGVCLVTTPQTPCLLPSFSPPTPSLGHASAKADANADAGLLCERLELASTRTLYRHLGIRATGSDSDVFDFNRQSDETFALTIDANAFFELTTTTRTINAAEDDPNTVPVRVVGRGGSGSRTRTLSVGTTATATVTGNPQGQGQAPARFARQKIDSNRMVGRGGMGSRRRELLSGLPVSVPVPAPVGLGQSKPIPPPEGLKYHRPTGRGGAGSRSRKVKVKVKVKPEPTLAESSNASGANALRLALPWKLRLKGKGKTKAGVATYGAPSLVRTDSDSMSRSMSRSSLYSAVEFASTASASAGSGGRYQNVVGQDPELDFIAEQSVHRHPTDADSTLSRCQSDIDGGSMLTRSMSESSHSELHTLASSSSRAGDSVGIETPQIYSADSTDWHADRRGARTPTLADYSLPTATDAHWLTAPGGFLGFKEDLDADVKRLSSIPFESNFLDAIEDPGQENEYGMSPRASIETASMQSSTWTGEWNRRDIGEVIGALRGLKL